jgi:hypothetical protein
MRRFAVLAVLTLGLAPQAFAQASPTCTTGLCLQQVSCPAGSAASTTTITGTVYAPNGTDPLPNVLVYIPNTAVDSFVPGVSCPVVGAPPSGSPVAGATTAFDGTFTILNAPVGANIPLVIVSGRWRRQFVIPNVSACVDNALPSAPISSTNTTLPFVAFPQNQTQGDIPKIAIATGAVDAVECVLRKVGLQDTEFTNPSGSGRINIYSGSGAAGAEIDTTTPSETTLMSNLATLDSYDVLMLPCEGGAFPGAKNATEYANLISFANAGGRVYSSHFSYQWMYDNPPFDTVANWDVNQSALPNGTATVNAGFSGGAELSAWLQLVGASTTPGQIAISTLKHDMNGGIAPSETWLTLNDAAANNPVMQLVWDTPVATTANTTGTQCGRVLYNEYHVEAVNSDTGQKFPNECATGAMTPQEKLLEYSLFELTNDGGAATLTPATQDFGSVAIGFNSAPQTFTWTNNSTFPASVTLLTGSGDFTPASNNCSTVAAYASCTITVVFNPSALGARTGTLTVGSSGSTLISSLTGTGIPDLSLSPATLTFGNLDVGASATQTLTATNSASGPVPVPVFVTTGDYAAANNCGTTLASRATCTITITFKPTTTGTRPGTLTVQTAVPGAPIVIMGNGVDFTFTDAPTSGTVIAGYNSGTAITTTPLAGFNATLTLSCTTNAPASTCTMSPSSFAPSAAVMSTVTITTTSQYVVIGYNAGFGGGFWLSLAGVASGLLLWMRRRGLGPLARSGLTILLLCLSLGAACLGMTGCSGKLPAQNAVYTLPGSYTYTVSATDGFLVHAATYALTVTAK